MSVLVRLEEHEKGYRCLERRDAMVSKPVPGSGTIAMCLKAEPGCC